MLRPASARKPLTAAISPGRSGQASSSRDVGLSVMRQIMAIGRKIGFMAELQPKLPCLELWRKPQVSDDV